MGVLKKMNRNIINIKDKKTGLVLFTVTVRPLNEMVAEPIYILEILCNTSNVLKTLDTYNKYTLIRVIDKFNTIDSERRNNIGARDKEGIIEFTKNFLIENVINELNKINDVVYLEEVLFVVDNEDEI